MDIPEIARRLFRDFAPPPREDYVLHQGFVRKVQHCQDLLPDTRMWPNELDHLPESTGNIRIDRRTIFDVATRAAAETVDRWAAAQLHAAIVFWGAPPGQSAHRAARPLSDPNAPHRLTEALKLVRGEGAESAYRVLSRRGRLWINGLGPSYFTKFLYFGGRDAKPYIPQPLIMDDNVIAGLIHITTQPWRARLEDYLDLAADVAANLQTDPDVVERRLFEIGESPD